MHLDNAPRASAEMTRVVKPGGHVVVYDPDWETLIVDAPDRNLTRKILNFGYDRLVNGWSGRRLVQLFRELIDTTVDPRTFISMDWW
jgi:ubiquinone/menaquinone biosynthesis C-methylase UbiE